MSSTAISSMFASIASRYDLANDVLSFGQHRLWRKRALRRLKLFSGATLLDLCTGTGDLALAAAREIGPEGRVFGFDVVQPMLSLAERKKSRDKLPPELGAALTFICADALTIPFADESADFVTVSFGIRNVEDPLLCLKEMKRLLKPGGRALVLEFGQPTFKPFALLYRSYAKWLMPLIGGLLTGNRAAYQYLPETAEKFPAGEKFAELMQQAGLREIKVEPIFFGLAYIYLGNRSDRHTSIGDHQS